MIAEGNCGAATSEGIINTATGVDPRVIVLLLSALEEDASLTSGIKHDRVPCLSSGTPEQSQECITKALEIGVFVHGVLAHVVAWDLLDTTVNLDHGELRDANNGVHEDEQEEQQPERTHGRHGINQSLEYDLQLLCSLDKSEDSADSQ